jgi:hypothetical protein
MIKSAVNIALALLFASVLLTPGLRAENEPAKATPTAVQPQKPDKAEEKPKVEEPKQAEPTQNYDDFTDENKNGIDDQFEKAEKKKVKVQEAGERTKQTEPVEKTEAKKKSAPDK